MRLAIAMLLGASLFASTAQAGFPFKKVDHKEVVAAPVVVEAFTLEQACCALKDLPPGKHQITFIHPATCCPVTVCFCLPCGCYDLECGGGLFAEKLVFSYPGLCNNVVIKFKKNGSVSVSD